MGILHLAEDEVHVWYLRVESLSEPFLRECEAVLSPDEAERWQRFTFDEGRLLYLASHGFLRLVLSRYADLSPREWRFGRNRMGKPELALLRGQEQLRSLCFNLTHTDGLAACVVAREREVGIDAEDMTRRGREVSADLIRYCLSTSESVCFENLPSHQRRKAFFDYWTLKEAYLKARGFGLSLPVEAITFHWPSGVPHEGRPAVVFEPTIQDNPGTWQFERWDPTARHKVAVALRHLGQSPLDVTLREYPT